jgi:hypothetical protein
MQKSETAQKSVPVIIIFFAIFTFISTGDAAMHLTQYTWKNRLLFVFAPHSRHPSLIDLRNEIPLQKEEILDRDLIVFQIYETGSSFKDMNEIDHETADKLRREFKVSPGHLTVILVGKDGGVKLRQNEQLNLEQIFLLIDAMPMRRQEMRRKNQ